MAKREYQVTLERKVVERKLYTVLAHTEGGARRRALALDRGELDLFESETEGEWESGHEPRNRCVEVKEA